MNAARVPTLAALFLATALGGCASTSSPAAGGTTLSVRVEAEPKAGLKLPHLRPYDTPAAEQDPTGTFERVDYGALDEIVVWVEPAEPKDAPVLPAADTLLDVKPAAAPGAEAPLHLAYVGQPIPMRNAAAKPLNLYSVSDGNEFDLGKLAPGASGTYVVKSPGLIELLREGAADPVLRIYAVPAGWAKLTRSNARVDFDLPPGTYTIHSWHPRLPGTEFRVTVNPGQTTRATIKVGVNGLPKVGAK